MRAFLKQGDGSKNVARMLLFLRTREKLFFRAANQRRVSWQTQNGHALLPPVGRQKTNAGEKFPPTEKTGGCTPNLKNVKTKGAKQVGGRRSPPPKAGSAHLRADPVLILNKKDHPLTTPETSPMRSYTHIEQNPLHSRTSVYNAG